MNELNPHIHEDLTRLRDELYVKLKNTKLDILEENALIEVFWKINSCLYKGYPRRERNEQQNTGG